MVYWLLRDRLAAFLYAEAGPYVAGLLDTEVKKRADALRAFFLKSSPWPRRLKFVFRARMQR